MKVNREDGPAVISLLYRETPVFCPYCLEVTSNTVENHADCTIWICTKCNKTSDMDINIEDE